MWAPSTITDGGEVVVLLLLLSVAIVDDDAGIFAITLFCFQLCLNNSTVAPEVLKPWKEEMVSRTHNAAA